MLRTILFALALASLATAGRAQSETGVPLMDVYLPRDYEGHPQCYGAVQDRTGLLYVGSRASLLTFDGQTWGAIPTPGDHIRGVAIDANDRIWVGGYAAVGYRRRRQRRPHACCPRR